MFGNQSHRARRSKNNKKSETFADLVISQSWKEQEPNQSKTLQHSVISWSMKEREQSQSETSWDLVISWSMKGVRNKIHENTNK
jgi:hypothetical protein